MRKRRLAGWIGSLFSPAENPRAADASPPADAEAMLAELRRSRLELTQLRAGLEADSPVSQQIEIEAESLLEAEQNLAASLHERRARAALLRARRRAIEAELLTDV